MQPSTPAAIVFDMDGTLLDSERIALSTFNAVCAQFDLLPNPEVYRRCIGTRAPESQRILMELYGPSFPLEPFFAAWSDAYRIQAIEAPVPVKDGVVELLNACAQLAIPIAVATSTRRESALLKLTKSGLLQHFAFVLGGDDVTHGKPHPQIYLSAAQRLQIDPQRVWAIEDSDTGVRSAHGAGMTVFQIPDLHEPDAEVRALGHHIVTSMHAVRALLPEH